MGEAASKGHDREAPGGQEDARGDTAKGELFIRFRPLGERLQPREEDIRALPLD